MPHSQGISFTADRLTFIVRHQLWDGNVEDHVDQGISIDVAADVDGRQTALFASTASILREAISTARKIPI